ncbi:MAG: ATP synthase F1 subunit delta [Polyangiaceae bacterium]|nr:ATP synthase F1 subunit delta [Polyangiaceae bacterium]
MSVAAVGERYARALSELAAESGQLEAATRQVAALAELYATSSDLRSVLDNPIVPEAKRKAVLDAIVQRLGLSAVVRDTVRLLARRRRLAVLPDLARSLQRLADERSGVARVVVTSATPLSEGDAQRLVQVLEGGARRRVVLERRLDPTLIAGVITRIGDKVIDGSLRGRLDALERRLLES